MESEKENWRNFERQIKRQVIYTIKLVKYCTFLLQGMVIRQYNCFLMGFPGGSAVKNPPANTGDMGLIPGSGRSSGREDPLEEEMVTRSSILAWRILWTEEPGGLQSVGLHRVGHD